MVAADQCGVHLPERDCYGHSMIVDPWGTVLAQAADGVGLCVAELDLSAVDRVRAQLPALAHRRADVYRPGVTRRGRAGPRRRRRGRGRR